MCRMADNSLRFKLRHHIVYAARNKRHTPGSVDPLNVHVLIWRGVVFLARCFALDTNEAPLGAHDDVGKRIK